MVAAKVPLVLVPALGSDERLWQPVIERLSGTVETVVLRGEGDTIASMAGSVLDRAPGRFFLAGISMGGYVALDIALRRTGRVLGLALLNTSAISVAPDRRGSSLTAIELTDAGQFETAVTRVSSGVAPARPDVGAIAGAMARDLGPEVFKAHQLAVLDRADRRAELGSIDVPTLVITGDADGIVAPALSEELSALIPGAELATLDGVGHLSTLEDPGRVASRLREWLRRAQG